MKREGTLGGLTCAAAFFTSLAVLGFVSRTQAHQLSLAVLSLTEVTEGQFVTTWEKAPGVRDEAEAYRVLRPVFPEHCSFAPPNLDCRGGGLFGALGFEGLDAQCSSGVINIVWRAGEPQSFSFTSAQPTLQISADGGDAGVWLRIAQHFARLGVEHILFGWDHLLFVLGLLWLVKDARTLCKTITGFTIAHSITLSAATLGWARVPVPPVEVAIALSIVFVAVEASKRRRGEPPGLTVRFPWIVAFSFGLLHGFGFASALSEVSLAQSSITLSLLFFNVGVELGQLAFVAVVWPLGGALRRFLPELNRRSAPVAYYAAGTLAMFWVCERMISFWP